LLVLVTNKLQYIKCEWRHVYATLQLI